MGCSSGDRSVAISVTLVLSRGLPPVCPVQGGDLGGGKSRDSTTPGSHGDKVARSSAQKNDSTVILRPVSRRMTVKSFFLKR